MAATIPAPSSMVHSQSYKQIMAANGAVVKQLQHQQQQQQQSCSTEPMDSSSSSAVTKPNFNSVGEIATGVMLAGCVTSWGWGYGLGWQEPVKHLFSNYNLMIHTFVLSCTVFTFSSITRNYRPDAITRLSNQKVR